MKLSYYFQDFVSIIWPRICLSCGNTLFKHENEICTKCWLNLPQTNFHFDYENPITKVFWGRLRIETAASFFYFTKSSKVQHLIHCLKYKGNKEVGIVLGKAYGYELNKSEYYKNVDRIIPVPLHPKRLRARGYNQSEMIGLGLAESMEVLLDTDTLTRSVATATQTKKGRFERWENVSEVFKINNAEEIEGNYILLVDDVLTTGATIEACAQVLLNVKNVKLSIITLACAIR